MEEETKQTLKKELPNYDINKVVIYQGKRKDWIIQLKSGKIVIINKNGGVVRTI